MSKRTRPRWSDRTALGVSVGVLGTYAAVRHALLPNSVHTITNTAMVGVMGALAAAAGLSSRELGLSRDRLGAGLRWGGAAVAAIGAATGLAAVVTGDFFGFGEDRTDLSTGALWFDVLVRIPIATVALEELAFRGVIAALMERITTPGRALLGTALLFGLWHVGPASSTSDRELLGIDSAALATAANVVGTVAVTAVAGVIFHLLRRRSGSLAAPSLAHWGTNGLTLAIAWLATS